MGKLAIEQPAGYLLATQFHGMVREMVSAMDHEHDYLSIELIKYSERILGNVGAAEAPYAAPHRQLHYQMAFAAICGCASACDIVRRLGLAPKRLAEDATHTLASLAGLVRPIAEEGMEARGAEEQAILDDLLGGLEEDEEDWKGEDDAEEAW